LLFEQVLWTYFFDRKDCWVTTWPDRAKIGAEYIGGAEQLAAGRARIPRPEKAAAPDLAGVTRGIAPAAPAPAEKLAVGDIVEITRGRYEGLIGQITELVPDGPFVFATVKLPADAEYLDIPGFRLKDLKRVE
jgi:hypothetical protein